MKFICPLVVVKDINRARHFYEDILGQVVKYDFGENIQFEGDFSIHLEKHFKELIDSTGNKVIQHQSNNFELYFESENIIELERKLKLAEVEFIHDLTEQPWGQKVIRVYDYDGHIIEIGESMETGMLD
jgi:catechol 2,3-dioxygenase-like lactoylglutathione lyase family enzyme